MSLSPRATRSAAMALVLAGGLFLPNAATASPEVNAALRAAEQSYDDLNYEQALDQVYAAKRLARSTDELVAVGLYEGILLSVLHHPDEAQASFESALLRNPRGTLPLKVSPNISRQFETLRHRVQAELARNAPPRSVPVPGRPIHVRPRPRPAPLEQVDRTPTPMAPLDDTPPRPPAAPQNAESPPVLAPPLSGALPSGLSAKLGPPTPPSKLPGYVLLGVAGGLGVGAAVLIVQSRHYEQQKGTLSFNDAQALRRRSSTELSAGTACGVSAGVAAGVGLWWLWRHRGEPSSGSVALGPVVSAGAWGAEGAWRF